MKQSMEVIHEMEIRDMQRNKAVDILNEEFEIPIMKSDLQELIEGQCELFEGLCRSDTRRRKLRDKLNELIDEYNERIGIKIYVPVK